MKMLVDGSGRTFLFSQELFDRGGFEVVEEKEVTGEVIDKKPAAKPVGKAPAKAEIDAWAE